MTLDEASPAAPGPDRFIWAVGVEDTFIPQVHVATGRVLDEYELTQHYRFWREDIDRIASLGVSHVRYGIPWYRVNPAPGEYDWSWTDRVVPYLVQDARLEPTIDLMHYGCPLWLERQFIHPDYPRRVAEYAAAFAERYRGLVRWFTPLNEPIINAWYCGRSGVWPPYLRGQRCYVRVLMALVEGIAETTRALRAAVPDLTVVHVEACSLPTAAEGRLRSLVDLRRSRYLLPADLLLGRVDDAHPLHGWLLEHGARPRDLERFHERPERFDIFGVNFYPHLSRYQVTDGPGGAALRRAYATAADMARVLADYQRHYGVPVMVTETSDRGPVWRRARWMDAALEGVRMAVADGIPVAGFTWFPVFSLVTWEWRSGRHPLRAYWAHMGLWDLVEAYDGTLERRETPLVARYRDVVVARAAARRPTGAAAR